MLVATALSTQGGKVKTTAAENLGGFAADAGLRCVLVALDVQPRLSGYSPLTSRAPGGMYELLAHNERQIQRLVSHATIANLHLVLSNDDGGQLNTLLLHAPDGRLQLRHLLPVFQPHYDLAIVDTHGAGTTC